MSAEARQSLKDVAVGFAGGSRHLQFFEIKQGKSSESGLAAGFFPIGSGKVGFFHIDIYAVAAVLPHAAGCHVGEPARPEGEVEDGSVVQAGTQHDLFVLIAFFLGNDDHAARFSFQRINARCFANLHSVNENCDSFEV